jgi:hypothetical protein
MSRFKWGHSFFSTNDELLDRYAACDTAAEVIAVQARRARGARRGWGGGRGWSTGAGAPRGLGL